MKIQKYFLLHNKKLKPWIKYWLYIKSKDKNYVLSDILDGTSFYLENSSNKNFNLFQINGNSIQNGTPTPSNQVPINSAGDNINLLENTYIASGTQGGITHTKNTDGTMLLNGTATTKVFMILNTFNLPAGTYILSGCPNGGSEDGYRQDILVGSNVITRDFGSGGSFTLNESTSIQARIRIGSGTAINNLTFKPMIIKGSIATPYSPYGMGSINEVISNKNLLPNNIESGTINGITVIKDVDGGYIFNGTAERGTYFYMFDNKIIKIPAGTYKQSVHKSGNVNGNSYFEMIDINGNTVSGGALNMYNTESKTITLTQDVWIKNARIYFGNGRILNNFKIYPMLEAGNVITDYVEHQEQNISIPCQQPMRSIGNVRDGFVKIDGVWYEKHNIGQVVLNGSENWEVYSGASNIFFSNISSLPLPKNANLNVFCNYYTSTLSTNSVVTFVSETTGLNYAIGTHVTAPIVRIKDIRYTTPSELSSWLSTHNTEVIYQLAEPYYLECTQEQIEALESIIRAYTYEPITNINSTDITPAFLKIQYYMEV